MVSGTLYTYAGNFRANRIQIAAAYSGSSIAVDSSFEYGKTNVEESFLKKFPLGKVPALEDSNGNCLDQTNAIAQYVSNESLLGGKDSLARAKVQRYIEFADNEILPSACTWTFPTLGYKQYNKQDTDKAMEKIKTCLTILNNDLLTKTFLVGERITLADISLCCNLVILYVQVLDKKFREPYGNVNRWFTTCINQPNFKSILGDVKLCEKMATFDNKKYQELHPKTGKKGGAEKADKKTNEPKKEKEQKPAPSPAEEPEKPKAKKPEEYFESAPPSKFVMDDWKKMYRNNPTDVSWAWFNENFDKNGYSIWHGVYKYPEENRMDFMASNLAGGFCQRIDGLRKFAMGLLGVTKNSTKGFDITAWFILRGKRFVFDDNENWNVDAPSFIWKELSIDNEEDKKSLSYGLNNEDWEDFKLFV